MPYYNFANKEIIMHRVFSQELSGRALKGSFELMNNLGDYALPSDVARIREKVDAIYEAEHTRTGRAFIPFYRVLKADEGDDHHFVISVEWREQHSVAHPKQIGCVAVVFVGDKLTLVPVKEQAVLKNAAWDIRGLKYVMMDYLRVLSEGKKVLLKQLIAQCEELDKEHPFEFLFDVDSDEERLSIVARQNFKNFTAFSVYY